MLLIVVMIFLIPSVFDDPTQIIPGKPVSSNLLCLYLVTVPTLVYLFTLDVNKPTGRMDSFLVNHSYGIYVYQSLSFPLIAISEGELRLPVTTGVQRFLVILFFTVFLSLIGEYIISKLGRLNSSHKVKSPIRSI